MIKKPSVMYNRFTYLIINNNNINYSNIDNNNINNKINQNNNNRY